MPTPEVVDRSGTWCVVGAGPHGLSATKALRQHGFAVQAFERSDDVGGNWNFGAPTSRVYESTHLISTKPFTAFPDFPMPDGYPDYPSHRQAHAYLRRYAEHFGLTGSIALGTEVVSAVPAVPGDGDGPWDVTVRDGAGERTERFAGLVVANGHNWYPKTPAYPGQEDFEGTLIHSADYKSADVLRGRRVLVVGAGNTGCDVAVESAQNAETTYHSTRRGYWYNPKYAFGRPSDQTADLLLALRLPLAVRRALFGATLRLTVGDFTRFGLPRPDHKFFETHPIVNQQLVYYVGHGSILPRPDVARFTPDGVVFADGTSAQVDVVVCCTGYLARFPFLDPRWLNVRGDHPQLARQVFTPASDALFVSGLIQPDSGQWTLAHWQGMLVAAYLVARRERPQVAAAYRARVLAEVDRRFSAGTDYAESTRHYYEIAHQEYLEVLERDLHELEGVAGAGRAAGALRDRLRPVTGRAGAAA